MITAQGVSSAGNRTQMSIHALVSASAATSASDSHPPPDDETEVEEKLRREAQESLKRYEAMQALKEARRRLLLESEARAHDAEVEWQKKRKALKDYALLEHARLRKLVGETFESHRRAMEQALELAVAVKIMVEKAERAKQAAEAVPLVPVDSIASQFSSAVKCLQDVGCQEEAVEAESIRWEVEDCAELVSAARDCALAAARASFARLIRAAEKFNLQTVVDAPHVVRTDAACQTITLPEVSHGADDESEDEGEGMDNGEGNAGGDEEERLPRSRSSKRSGRYFEEERSGDEAGPQEEDDVPVQRRAKRQRPNFTEEEEEERTLHPSGFRNYRDVLEELNPGICTTCSPNTASRIHQVLYQSRKNHTDLSSAETLTWRGGRNGSGVLVKENGKFLPLFIKELKSQKLWKGSPNGTSWSSTAT
ncbi:hypothetical protein M427DRAFT_54295 [Gonapodya prolifera JEL478]|uniref:Uncharacterized protein n=1 Tax=Gonapodya prolifera (strain JEL478) TaxID=1344416 RepID=A0A139ALN4_GONPJ|nr:hypothetical protein M427DRAFT_54295 [Gonapodya prolifera JEL478]|eukprot:KXS17697.1 hypothetical protein M427DRAFT_54295 [Gonapodya prolifera JEL478]